MKSSQISVNSLSDIPAAVEYVERYASSAQHASGAHACPLVCEEILLRLLKKGCSGISVAVKGRLFRHVEIRAAGARADADSGSPESEENEIMTEETKPAGHLVFNIDVMLAKRKMSVTKLAEAVGITLANMSILKSGKAKAIKVTTIEKLCDILDCQPGDLFEYVKD